MKIKINLNWCKNALWTVDITTNTVKLYQKRERKKRNT